MGSWTQQHFIKTDYRYGGVQKKLFHMAECSKYEHTYSRLKYDRTPSLAYVISLSPFASYGQRPFWPWRISHSVNNVQKNRQHERLLRFQYQHDCTRQRNMAREVATKAHHVHPTGHVLKLTAYDKEPWFVWLQQKRNTFFQQVTCSNDIATSEA